MRRFIGIVGDKVQAAFPPNRLAILLAAPILAAAAWVSGVVAANIPGVNLPVGVIAGVMGAGVLIVARLLDRWFDQWQKGEPIDVDEDLDQALDELVNSPDSDALYRSLGTMHAVADTLAAIQGRIARGEINEAEIAKLLDSLGNVVEDHLEGHGVEVEPAPDHVAESVPAGPVAPAESVPPAGS